MNNNNVEAPNPGCKPKLDINYKKRVEKKQRC